MPSRPPAADAALVADYYRGFFRHAFAAAIAGLLAARPRSAKGRQLRAQCAARFGPDGAADLGPIRTRDPFARAVVAAFRLYWRAAFLDGPPYAAVDARLGDMLAVALAAAGCAVPAGLDDSLDAAAAELGRRGLHCNVGRTLPLYCTYLWKRQTTRNYDVDLPLGRQRLTVVFMRDFVELGWLHFGTFGRSSTGGWVADDAIYCVSSLYKRDSAAFRAYYLSHEAQHFQDRAAHPNLVQTDLEYRAKLVELIAARSPLARSRDFKREAVDNPANPHGYAAHLLLQGLAARLGTTVPTAVRLRQAARALFDAHTVALRVVGARKVRTVLPPKPSSEATFRRTCRPYRS